MTASQKMITITLALAAAVAQADNCGTWSSNTMEFKTTGLETTRCTTLAIGAGSCTSNCCKMKEVCAKFPLTACTDADHVKDDGKKAVDADSTNAGSTKCCSPKATCSSLPCGGGQTAKAGTTKCAGTTCTATECCDVTTKTCAGQLTAKLYGDTMVTCSTGSAYDDTKADTAVTNIGMWQSTCCKNTKTCAGQVLTTPADALNCGLGGAGDTYLDSAKAGSELKDGYDTDTFKSTCCTAYKKCSTHSCNTDAGWKKDSTKDTTNCLVTGCADATCCKPDPDKCLGAVHMSATIMCASTDLQDSSKAGVSTVGASEPDKKTACCTAKPTCQEAKAKNLNEGVAGGAMRRYQPVVALFAVLAALAFRM